jgi:hypothetical protein
VITRKGGKVVTIPLAPRTARAIDLAIGERSEGPVFLAAEQTVTVRQRRTARYPLIWTPPAKNCKPTVSTHIC